MAKSNEILKTNHIAQLKWLDGQLRKNNMSIFLNGKIATDAYEKLNQDSVGLISNEDVEHFVATKLSEQGIKKLITTLRVAESRSKSGFPLQANITEKNKSKLDYLTAKTGMKQNEVINKLIEMSDLQSLTKTEEQLEITL